MSQDIFALFDKYSTFTPDDRSVQPLIKWVLSFMNKNENHAAFFQSNLLGVNPIRFIDGDRDRWLETMGITDVTELQSDIHSLPNVLPEQRVRSDVFNLSIAYAAHKVFNSRVSTKLKQVTLEYIFIGYLAKLTSGLLWRRFRHAAVPDIAMALYESLDNSTYLKKYGSWIGVFTQRAKDINDTRGIHHPRIRGADDEDWMYMVAEISTRMHDMVQELTNKFHDIKDNKARISTTSKIGSIDGEAVLKDTRNATAQIRRTMDRVARDPRDFIRGEIMELTIDAVLTCEERYLKEALNYYVDNYKRDKDIQRFQEATILFLVNAAKDRRIDIKQTPLIVGTCKTIFRASNTKRKDALEIKTAAERIIQKSVSRSRASVQVSTKMGLLIYLVLRILSQPRYSDGAASLISAANENKYREAKTLPR